MKTKKIGRYEYIRKDLLIKGLEERKRFLDNMQFIIDWVKE